MLVSSASVVAVRHFAIVWLCVHVGFSFGVIAGEYLRNEDEL